MRTIHKTLTALMLSLLMAGFLVPSIAAAVETPDSEEPSPALDHPVDGHIHVDLDIYHVPGKASVDAYSADPENLPAKLDPREESWYKNSISVKDQGNSNTCWACAAAAAAEISYAKETQAAVDAMSPVQIAYFFFNRVNDPLGNTGGDKNNTETDWNQNGGSCGNTFQHLTTRSGMVTDVKAPLSELRDYYSADPDRTPAPTYDESLAYGNNALTLENCEILASLPNTEAGRNAMKHILMEYGAAVVSMDAFADAGKGYFPGDYFKDGDNGNEAFYKPDAYDSNDHEVVLVGWDDTYSKDNFGSWNWDTQQYDAQPEEDGAWIMQNSWGTVGAGDHGYYYVSYESSDILSDGILAMDMEPAGSTKLYQYDGNANSTKVPMEVGEQCANVFCAPEDHEIRVDQVGFTTYNDGRTDYTVDIYTGLTDSDNPASGCKAMDTQSISTDTPGYKTIPLSEPVTVDAGESWSVVITFKGHTSFGVEASEKYGEFYAYEAELAPNQSFYTEDGKNWHDAAEDGFCCRIKGVASDVNCQHDYPPTGEVHAPTKNAEGYTIYQCTKCGHKIKTDITPMLEPVPDPTKITSLTAADKAFTVKWAKDSELVRNKHITGYQIRYSLKSDMSSAKTITVTGWGSVSRKVTGLQEYKTYYVQVRPYYTESGTAYCPAWSAKKSVRTPWSKPVLTTTKITKLTAAKKAFTVKWAKSSKLVHNKHITGYQVRYSLKSGMGGAKTVTVKGWSTVSRKVAKLKGKKKYYIQVRTYFKENGKTYYSKWSGKKTIRTK